MTIEKRAQEVGHDLLGTCAMLEQFATPEEIADRAFCAALDEQVMECQCCGWWCESGEMNDDQHCEECQADVA